MSKARREKKKANNAKTTSKSASQSPVKQAAVSKRAQALKEVFAKADESIDEFIKAVEVNLKENQLPEASESDLKNAELRWQRHYTSARKSIAQDDMETAVRELQGAVKFAERLADYRLANTYGELGFVSMRLKEFSTARVFFKMALSVRQSLYGAEHPSVGIEYSNLAMSYEWQGDLRRAKPLLEAAVSILDKSSTLDALNYAEPYEALASLYKAKMEFAQAEEHCHKALAIRDRLAGRLHPISIKTVELLIDIHSSAGKARKVKAARQDYEARLQEYADSKSFGAAAKMLKHLLEFRDSAADGEKSGTSISDFLKMVARR